MAKERHIALGIMKIAASQPNGICSFKRAYSEIPNHVGLSTANLEASIKRPGEPMWYQLVRNIKSHDKSNDNYISKGLLVHVPRVGYRVTAKGRSFLK